MKIGILTLPFNNNYGGYLQAYALMTILKEMGHEVELIYRRKNRRNLIGRVKYIIKNILKIILRREHGPLIPNQEWEHRKRGKLMMSFVDANISPKTSPIYSTEQLYHIISNKNYDYIVVGSDQVWNPNYGQKHVQDFFLTQLPANTTPRLTYAASFGFSESLFSEEEKKECGEAVKNFTAISLRENSGVDLINSYGWKVQKAPVVVLDPTLLLSSEHYLSLIKSQVDVKEQIFCYILDRDVTTNNIVNRVVEITKIKPFNIIDTEKWERNDYLMPSIESWIAGIKSSKLVITDSYHGMVFSIIMCIPFIVKVNHMRGGDRFVSLLKRLGLESRMINEVAEVDTALHSQIDWVSVKNNLREEQLKSISFLKNNLK